LQEVEFRIEIYPQPVYNRSDSVGFVVGRACVRAHKSGPRGRM